MSNMIMWLTVGFLGQALFTARFLVQWLASERKRESIVPVAFWWLSLLGGIALLRMRFPAVTWLLSLARRWVFSSTCAT